MICLKEGEVWQKVFLSKIFSFLSHKACCLLSSPVGLLRKFTILQLLLDSWSKVDQE